MRFEDPPEIKRQRRKAKLIMALICGPVFMLTLVATSYLFTIIPKSVLNFEHHWFKISCLTSFSAMVFVADRLGKHLRLTAKQFAGPTALSCAFFSFLAFTVFVALN